MKEKYTYFLNNFISDIEVFYIFPILEFLSYSSEIALVEEHKRQRKPKSADYRNAWELIQKWATLSETPA